MSTLSIKITGEIIESNFEDFKSRAQAHLQTINLEPATDAEFGEATEVVKGLKNAEDALKSAKEEALSKMEAVYSLFTGVDELTEEVRSMRLKLDKAVKTQKQKVKDEIILDALGSLVTTRNLPHFKSLIIEGVKGKRTIDSIESSAKAVVESANNGILESREVIESFTSKHGTSLVPDSDELELNDVELVKSKLETRLERYEREEIEKAQKAKELAEAKAAQEAAKPEPVAEPVAEEVKPTPVPTAEEAPKREEGMTADQEFAWFKGEVVKAFAPVKAARQNLKHSENSEKAEAFAKALGEAWKVFNQ